MKQGKWGGVRPIPILRSKQDEFPPDRTEIPEFLDPRFLLVQVLTRADSYWIGCLMLWRNVLPPRVWTQGRRKALPSMTTRQGRNRATGIVPSMIAPSPYGRSWSSGLWFKAESRQRSLGIRPHVSHKDFFLHRHRHSLEIIALCVLGARQVGKELFGCDAREYAQVWDSQDGPEPLAATFAVFEGRERSAQTLFRE